MLSREAPVRIDVSEECIVSIIRVKRICDLLVTTITPSSPILFTLTGGDKFL
jgi:hypothetical protein